MRRRALLLRVVFDPSIPQPKPDVSPKVWICRGGSLCSWSNLVTAGCSINRTKEVLHIMRSFMTAALVTVVLLAGVSVFASQVSIGVRIGPPPPPRVVYVAPAQPTPEFVWIDSYWYVVKNRYKWHEGYWTRPPYPGAYWVPPRHDGRRFFLGYWDGDHGRFEHDHHWDRERDRDFHHERHRQDGDHDR